MSAKGVGRTGGVMALVGVLLVAGCGDPEIATVGQLEAALQSATPGTRIVLMPRRFVGSFRLPPGVTLVGSGPGTLIVGPSDRNASALIVETGALRTTISNLTVVSPSRIAIHATGGGEVEIERVSVEVKTGIGIGVQDIARLVIRDVRVLGEVTPDNALDYGSTTELNGSSHGVVAMRVRDVDIAELNVTGFANFGALFVESRTRWVGGTTAGHVGTGLMVYGGSANLTAVSSCDTFDSGTIGKLPYGAVFAGNATIETSDLRVCDGKGWGILQDNSVGRHRGLTVTDNSQAGVWVQYAGSLFVNGDSTLSRNGLAGIVVAGSDVVELTDLTIRDTRRLTTVRDGFSAERGDGIHLLDSTGELRVANAALTNNPGVGLFIDDTQVASPSRRLFSLTNVLISVAPGGDEPRADIPFGAVFRTGVPVPGWDQGIVRGPGLRELRPDFDPSEIDRLARRAYESTVGSPAGIVGPSD